MRKLNKTGLAAIDYIIFLIIGLVVLAVVLFAVYKADIIDYFRLLPVDEPVDGEDIYVDTSDVAVRSACPVIVARIKWDEKKKHSYIKFCGDIERENLCKNSELIESNLYWKGDSETAKILVDIRGWKKDGTIGEVKTGKISLNEEIINRKGIYDKIKGILPEYIPLINLEGADYFYGNFICRKEVIKDEFNQVTADLINTPIPDDHPRLVGKDYEIIANFKAEEGKKKIYYYDNGDLIYSFIYATYDNKLFIEQKKQGAIIDYEVGYTTSPSEKFLGRFYIEEDFPVEYKVFLEKLKKAEYIGENIYLIDGGIESRTPDEYFDLIKSINPYED